MSGIEKDEFGRSDLHYVTIDYPITEHYQRIKKLVDSGYEVDGQDSQGWTALHFAAQENSITGTKALIEAGARVDLVDSNGNTVLFRAVVSSKVAGEIIEALLASGADPALENNYGVSPRGLAETITNFDIAQFFRSL